jgi:hypothetical protein
LLKGEVEYLNFVFEGKVVFVGAIAVFAHLGWKRGHRTTKEIGIAAPVGEEIVERLVEEGKLNRFYEQRKYVYYTPRGVKVDLFLYDVSGISVPKIYSNSVLSRIARSEVRIPRLEHLLVMKYRSGRAQERDDIEVLLRRFHNKVDWKLLDKEHPDESRGLKALARILQ